MWLFAANRLTGRRQRHPTEPAVKRRVVSTDVAEFGRQRVQTFLFEIGCGREQHDFFSEHRYRRGGLGP